MIKELKFKIFDEISEEYFGYILNFVDSVMKEIQFGMFDENGEEILNEDDYYENTRIQSPENVINKKKGNSVDQVNLEYWFFKDNGLKPSIYYTEYTTEDKISPSHMFIIVEYNNKVFWYENAWKKQAGLHQYNSLVECLNDIKLKFCPGEYMDTCKVYRIKDLREGTNPNKVLERKIVRINDKPTLYLLSETKLNEDEVLNPTVPSNYLTEYGFADTRQERITVYPRIKDALYTNTFDNLRNKVYNVYSPIYNTTAIYVPTEDESPTSKITHEVWLQEPVNIKKIGTIKVKRAIEDKLYDYNYGNNNIGKLKLWEYDVIDGNIVKDSFGRVKKYQTYLVIDDKKKILYQDNYAKCEEYLKSQNTNAKIVLKETYNYLNDKDIECLFKNTSVKDNDCQGLKIIFGEDKDYNCYTISVVDCSNNEEIDNEFCYDKKDIRYIIDCFRQQYKIKKVERRND